MELNPSYIKLEGTVFNKEKEKNEEIKCIIDATDEIEGKIIVENVSSSEIVLKFDNLVLTNGTLINGSLRYRLTEVEDF